MISTTQDVLRPGQVVIYRSQHQTGSRSEHGLATLRHMAARLAGLKRYEFAGDYDPSQRYDSLYFVPEDTLLHDTARKLGIQDENNLFGGCVQTPFAGTKSITHPLVTETASAPEGWNHDFPIAVATSVLAGFSVFSCADARIAGSRLLQRGAIRLKPALGIGGTGQTVVISLPELETALATIDPAILACYGLVLEQNLDQVVTFSVGRAQVDGNRISYHGIQRLTTNHQGESVYGGSSLYAVRGDYAALTRVTEQPHLLTAIEQARCYDAAAESHLGLMASRRNYDIAQGIDSLGQHHSGVLEQSWRIGGASPAEIMALEAFAADGTLQSITVSTHEVYDGSAPPDHAQVYFQGVDSQIGAIQKFCTIDAYEYSVIET